MSTHDARADEPVPLGQVSQSDAQPSSAEDPAAVADDWSGSSWAGHGWDGEWTPDASPGDGAATWDEVWNDWFDDASTSGWTWDDWFFGNDESEGPSPSEASWTDDEAPSDGAAEDSGQAAAAPSADAPSADTPSTDAPAADTMLATTTALATDVLAAPTMSKSGTTVSWTPTSGVSSYVFVRKVPGQSPLYSIVNGTSVTPPVVAGQTVSYGVRTNVGGSAWADEISIAYSASTIDPKTAPALSVSDTTLSWNKIGSVGTYLVSRTWPDGSVQSLTVNGTSTTPASAPGKTLRYRVRTSVTGSAWSREVSIAYPGTTEPPPADDSFAMGVTAGSAHQYELRFLRALGAKTARIEFSVGTSAGSLASDVDAYARAGIRPLLLATFHGRTPSTAEAQNLGNWAAAYGPGGTFWQGKSYPANTAVTHIEFGNETSYSYQFSDNSLSTYASRAQTYALRARDAANAVRAANARVGLLAQGDNAVNQTAWMTNLLKAVPTLDDLVAGWTIHPYGPNWASRIDSTVNSARTVGARDVPIWITEWGLSSDNGRCLSDNYGFDKCMTYGTAATTLRSVVTGMQSRYGSRLGAFFLYQAHDQYSSGSRTGREAYFGALQSNGSAKGAYTTEVKAELAAN